ncbi:MAG TPA: efflux transporter outer membrane subunit [Acetobacteraceae bacterium]|jgi:NodT family efflux transporter outer membrane factor (OMF) lipoprotein
MKRSATAILATSLLAGCTVGPNFDHPTTWWHPASWGTPAPSPQQATSKAVPEPVDPEWWKLLGDPQLTALETQLLNSNLDVRIASIRLAEARAQLGVSKADEYPMINGNASYLNQRLSKNGEISLLSGGGTSANGLGGAGGIPTAESTNGSANKILQPFDLYQAGFDASWEVDLWGRIRRNVESVAAQGEATQEAARDTLVTASAELARDYVQLRGLQLKLEYTRENLDSARQSLALTQQRAAGGVSTDLDVANAAAQVAVNQAQIPTLEQQRAESMNAIAMLLGREPRALEVELAAPKPIPPVPPVVPVGLPSELARRRPDIRRAEALLHSATADVGVAVADFFPRVTLSGSAELQAIQLHTLANWASGAYALGPSVTLPIFEGGQLKRTLELRKDQQQEAAVTYQRTVLNALHEVDNALTAYDAEQHRRDSLQQAVEQNRRALALARDRYSQGVADFLEVLTAQRGLLSAQQDLADSTTTVSTNLVQLYKALGGGWDNPAPVPVDAERALQAKL